MPGKRNLVFEESSERQYVPGVAVGTSPDRDGMPRGGHSLSPPISTPPAPANWPYGDGGFPLGRGLRSSMERTLDWDLCPVKIHTGCQADRLCRALDARAFTVGSDIFFANGEYDPATPSGRQLLAHELIHVVQQGSGRVPDSDSFGRPACDALEREAEQLAIQAACGERVDWKTPRTSKAKPCAVVQRQVNHLVAAANTVPATAALKPRNCHEAVLCWLLYAHFAALRNPHALSQGLPSAWLTLRYISDRYALPGNVPAGLTGQWIAANIYNVVQVVPAPPFVPATFAVGDILAFGAAAGPHHSMVVVAKNGVQALAKGFNNAGLIGGPYMNYDGASYDITNPNRWNLAGQFMGNNGAAPIRVMTYAAVAANLPNVLAQPYAGANF